MLMRTCRFFLPAIILLVALVANAQQPTAADAEKFVNNAEKQLDENSVKENRADWVQSNFITDDTEAIAADAEQENTALNTQFALEAAKYNGLQLPPDVARKLLLLRLSITLPAPTNVAEQEELTKLRVGLEADYGKGKYCPPQPAGA